MKMDISKISRQSSGLIVPNGTVAFETNVNDEVRRETYELLDKGESESRLDDRHEYTIFKSDNAESNQIICTEWGIGDKYELMLEDEDNENKHEKWYAFLDDLYSKLSEYDIQKDRERYNVADLDDWGRTDKPQGISVTFKTLKTFFDKIKNFNLAEYETMNNLSTITASKMDQLNKVLSLTLNHRPTIICSESYIVVKDNFISLNETIRNLESNSDTNNSCKNFKTQLYAGKRISVAIIAPKWEVIGSRSIDLKGADGIPHIQQKAKTGAHPGNNGSNGIPGNPGVSGESFFGIGDTFVNGANLKINSRGGIGGSGQDGGDGAPGIPGKDAIKPKEGDPECTDGKFREFSCKKGKVKTFRDYKREGKRISVYIYGEAGGSGGKGGDGGKGGKGGDPGNVVIIELRQPSKIEMLASKGEEGDNGKAGAGGEGGKYGNDINATSRYNRANPNPNYHHTWENTKIKQNNRRGTIGSNGTNGGNIKDIKNPVPAKGISRLSNVINEYKIFLRENINNPFQQCTLRNFLNLLDNSKSVRRLYDIIALSGEYQDLEEQFFKLRKHMDVSPFYRSLLMRIEAIAKDRKYILNSDENKKVLNYLYTTTLSRIVYLREMSQRSLIINIRGYLSMVKDNINELKYLQTINNKVDVINKYKDIYKSDFEKQIEEAKLLNENQIIPEFKKIYSNIDKHVNDLIKETIDLQKQAEKDWEKLAEKQTALGDAIAIKGLCNLFKTIGGVVSFLGPYGAIAGTVITGATTVGETLALSDQEKILSLPDPVAKDLKTLQGQIEGMRKQKLDYLENLVNNLSTEIENNPETLGDIKDKVDDAKGKLEKVRKKELEFKVASELQTQLEQDIKKKGVDLKKGPSNKKTLDAVEAIEKVTKIVEFGSLFTKMYSDMEKDKEKMNNVTTSMEKVQNKITMLRKYEKNIYETISPMLQEMEEHMEDVSAKLGTKSHVALDVTKWQVQSTLKNIRFQMQKLTKGHEDIKDEMMHCIENLEEAITTLINVYDRIQNFQDQQKLANYIADISSVAASGINIKDQELANFVNRLELTIRANIVLEQYKQAIDGFKQWVFPFEDKYIQNYMLPYHLEPEENIEHLVQTATQQIEEIKKKLEFYDLQIVNGGPQLMCEEFSSRFVSTQPFFVWKNNKKYRNSISRLLSGEEVVFRAYVEESDPHKDAIKFSEIDFDWKVENETSQSRLNEILKGFDMEATHSGNSYYRYDDKITLITSEDVKIRFSYEKGGDGIPIRANEVYRRLKSGDLLLSPYTLWKTRLINLTKIYSFKDLKDYKKNSNLELSGLGTYVEIREPNFSTKTKKRTKRESFSKFKGLIGCKRSVNRRAVRSINGIRTFTDFTTNGGAKVMPSQINFFNFVKSFFVASIVRTISLTFYGEQTSVRNDCSEIPGGCIERKDIGSSLVFIPTFTNVDSSSVKSDFIISRIENKSDIIFDVNFNGKSRCFNSFLLSDEKDRCNYHSTQFSDLNCSLLLADLIARTITGNRYKSSVDEYLLSPREVMLEKICRGAMRNEGEVKQMLERHEAEREGERSSSWFNKLDSYAKSILRIFGFVGNTDTEEYILDIRNLFT